MITAIVLTKNESMHIDRCIKNLKKINAIIKIVDSGSNDETLELAKKFKDVDVYSNKWTNYATQFNWAINNCDIKTEWVFRVDADEYMDDKLIDFINKKISLIDKNVNGIYVKRGIYFLNKLVKYGNGNIFHLKIWRNGYAYCEKKWMDEHMILKSGDTIKTHGQLIDHNLKSITEFMVKHNSYATREAIDFFEKYSGNKDTSKNNAPTHRQKSIYYRAPIFFRCVAYYFYILFFKRGIFDGVEGVAYHTIQKLFYRFLVDLKIHEARLHKKTTDENEIDFLIKNI